MSTTPSTPSTPSVPSGPTLPSIPPSITKWEIQHEFRKLCALEKTKAMGEFILNHSQHFQDIEEKKRLVEYCSLLNKPKALSYLIEFGFLEGKKEESELLIKAATYGCTKSVINLIKLGFNPHLKDKNGYSALSEACRRGHFGVVKTLLTVGIIPNTETHEELLASSLNQKNETLRLILEKYPTKILEEIAKEKILPGTNSKLPSVAPKGAIIKRKADELTKQIAQAILKEATKNKLEKIMLEKSNNTFEL
jgi:ankyrin repeat protein